ncbi:MAG TPA: MerC domain-containing protein [Pedomonas sp.]|uniref:MerC domain-containing protein n=1 Tax=Pedomonas sp. TaxID=2976421 RepID=UPI002F426504
MPRPDWLDFSAIGVSGLCLVHCLASGAFVVGLSAVSLTAPASHEFHLYTLTIAAILAAWALGRGWLRLRRTAPVALGGLGIALMAAGVHPAMIGWPEVALTVAGVTVLALAHVLNWRGLRKLDCGGACARHRAPVARLKDAA